MPHAHYPLSPDGLVVPALIGLTGQATAGQLAARQALTAPVQALALLDTGSDVTCVASRIVQQLQLPQVRQTSTTSIAGPVWVNIYKVSLSIPRPGGAPGFLLVLDQLEVMELTHPLAAAEVLLGLDVLRQLLLVLDGPATAFILAD